MTKNISKGIVQFILKWQAKAYILTRRPYIMIVAGTTSRLWMKEKAVEALREKGFDVVANKKNFNAEIGLPLSILGLESGEGDFSKWSGVISQGFKKVFGKAAGKYLVLEAAINRPEDMKYLLSIVRPKAVILTTVTMIYQENFEDLDNIVNEYKTLVEALPTGGSLILNHDDGRVRALSKHHKKEKVVTYGFHEKSDFRATDVKKMTDGQEFLIKRKNKNISKKINRFGSHHVYAELVKEAVKEVL